MFFIGMIYQFNSDQGTGLIMSSDGETKEFSVDNWTDESQTPYIGLQVLYEYTDNTTKIRVATESEKSEDKLRQQRQREAANTQPVVESPTMPSDNKSHDAIKSVDEQIQFYKDEGFNLINDIDENGLRKARLRRYVMGEFAEVLIECKDNDITVTKTLNGQKVD